MHWQNIWDICVKLNERRSLGGGGKAGVCGEAEQMGGFRKSAKFQRHASLASYTHPWACVPVLYLPFAYFLALTFAY